MSSLNLKAKITAIILSMAGLLIFVLAARAYNMMLEPGLSFSRESGFYEENFYLEILWNPHYTIRYTTDGSTPTVDSRIYTEPILITDASKMENRYSARSDTSICFYTDEIEKYGWADQSVKYVIPQFPVDKCNVVRAAEFNEEGEMVAEELGIYFVGFDSKEGYDGIQMVSIVTDPVNLFDNDTGIYVTGRKWDEFTKQGETVWVRWAANYFEKGIDWEREARVDIFDENRQHYFSNKAGIRIQGGASRTYAQKSLSVYAREEYGGSDIFREDLFQNGFGPHKFLLSAGGQDYQVKVKDYLIQSIEKNTDSKFSTIEMLPCALFLNGEYWGVYYLAESFNADYIETHYGIDEENAIVVKDAQLEDGIESDMDLYNGMLSFISDNDMREGSNYEKACELIDIGSFIDYYATEVYLGNTDWPYANVAMWRARETDSANPYCDGRWRWMLFDLNISGVMSIYEAGDSIRRTIEYDAMFASLIKNKDVQDMFCARLNELADKVYTEENIRKALDNWLYMMEAPLTKSSERFFGKDSINISSSLAMIQQFFAERKENMQEYMEANFDAAEETALSH